MALVVLGAAWLGGIFLGTLLAPPVWPGAVATVAAGGLAIWRRSLVLLLLAAAVAGLMAGMMRSQEKIASATGEELSPYLGQAAVQLRGVVAESPIRRGAGTELRVIVDAVRRGSAQDWQAVNATVQAQVALLPERQYGEYLVLQGNLEPTSSVGTASYADYLRRQGIAGVMRYPAVSLLDQNRGWPLWGLIFGLRQQLIAALQRTLPEPEAGLAQGILLGQRAALSPDLNEAFTRTNTSHVIAISGANISLVAGFLVLALRSVVGRLPTMIGSTLGILAYSAFVGFSPSVGRAAIMGIAFGFAGFLGRPRDATAALVMAAGVMTALEPMALFDLGFQLSFLATAGLVWLAEPLLPLCRVLPGWLGGLLTVTFAAEAATMPLIALTFGQFSLVGPLANLAVPPLLPFVMASSAVAALAGALSPPLGQLLGPVAWLFLALMVRVVESLSALPGAVLPLGQPGTAFALAYYAILAGLLLRHLRATTPLHLAFRALWQRLPALPTLAALAVVAAIVWSVILSLPDGTLHVSVLDVGQGDAILIRTPEHKILIDGGPNPDVLANALGRELPFWDRDIDLIVLTHPDDDHVAGLNAALERFTVRQVLATNARSDTASFTRFQDLVRARGLAEHIAEAGQEIVLGPDAALRVLYPPAGQVEAGNDDSIVLRLTDGDFGFLLTGDLGPAGRQQLLASGEELRATVLKVPHHGSADGLDAALLNAVAPEAAIISVGRGNRYGHPSPAILALLAQSGAKVYRTDRDGATEVVRHSNGYAITTRR